MTRDEMIEIINKAMPFSPSFANQDDAYVEKIYYKAIEQKNPAGKQDRTDIICEDVLTSLFGRTKGIEVEGIKVSRDSLKTLYEPLKLKKPVFKAIVNAHNEVLEYGLATGNEMVIAIDIDDSNMVASQRGTTDQVKWRFKLGYRGRAIAIHNHPNSTLFSPVDLYSFGNDNRIVVLGIQGHNGSICTYKNSKSKV